MHSLISVVLGVVFAWALCRKNETVALGLWRGRAGALGALFPYVDSIFFLGNPFVIMPERFTLMWTPFLIPIYAGIVATVLKGLVNKNWSALYISAFIGCSVSIFMAMLTTQGVVLLPYLSSWRIGLGVLYPFDFYIVGIAVLTIALAVLLQEYKRDVARLGILSVGVYIGCMIYFNIDATRFGQQYARALSLDIEKIYALPQPLSPLNWRLIIVEKGGERLHDTLIHLSRTAPLEVTETATRAYQIAALYKPKNEAVWRIYRRTGNDSVLTKAQRKYALLAWKAFQTSPLKRQARFVVLEKFTLPPKGYAQVLESCVAFTDIRFEGARKASKGKYLVCSHKTSRTFFTIFKQTKAPSNGMLGRYQPMVH